MPLFWLALAFLSGVGLAAAFPLPAWGWGGLSLLSAAGLAWPPVRHRWRVSWLPLPLLALPLALGTGALRYTLHQSAHNPTQRLIAWHAQGQVTLTGWICAPPDRRERVTLLTVCAEQLEAPAGNIQKVQGRVLVTLWPFQTWDYGQRLELRGAPNPPEESEAFSYRAYLERRGIYTQMTYPLARPLPGSRGNLLIAGLEALRQRAYALANRFYPQPEAALVNGILLGLDEDFPLPLERAYQITGTAHIIAISGFNMTLLSGTLLAVLGRIFPLGMASFLSLIGMGLYALLVGGDPAVLRAALMSGLALLARLIGRSSAALNALAFSAALLCLFNPTLPWEVSFQLSVMATLGLILYAEPLQSVFTRTLTQRWRAPWAGRLAAAMGEYVLVTLAAQVTTLPVLLAHFRRFSLSLLIANPLILPAQPALMVLGGLSLLIGLLAPAVGQVLAGLAWPLAAYTNRIVLGLSQNALASLTLPPFEFGSVLLYYAVVLGFTLAWQQAAWRPALRGSLLIGALGLSTVLAWNGVLYRPDGNLHLVLFDLPDSQAVLIRAPGGQTLLLDGAPSANALDAQLGHYLPVLGRRLDAMLVTSPRAAPLEGLILSLQRYEVGRVFWATATATTRTHTRLARALDTAGIPQQPLATAQVLDLPPDLALTVLPAEQGQVPLLVHHGRLDLLIAGAVWPTETLAHLNVQGVTLDGLILRGEGIAIPADALPDLGVLMGQPGQPLPPGWLATGLHGTLELTSDGQNLRLGWR
ncbi:ComEC/Rec2 family competence protein [Thermanaerothrix sp. 4228-RoL]|uniref:ComEC/Rec2 family competence protein n=1 Tax=Thermanaerothrix solaris TaxID=3058434 RepID=A0ABU3NNX6_9CHLR|nr:ComEC/Rec2 family competence protein [Thermanaerothrix sp. 4228-RoL]MDT8898560.1 ComEC/Rec2 family competence protein [Thermanaerothrix sp. 4228-RoL]